MWLLIILAVNINDPKDVPGKVTLEFPDQQSCETSLYSLKYKLKFDGFKVEGKCQKMN